MIYKYLCIGGEGSDTQFGGVLDSLSLKFSRLSSFNDVFEATPNGSDTMERILADLKRQVHRQYGSKLESDARRLGLQADEVLDRYFEHPNQKYSITKAMMSQADRMCAEVGVLSVSEVSDSLLMWSHYARSERVALSGICLGIDETVIGLEEIEIECLGLRGGYKVEYSDTRPAIDSFPFPDNLRRVLTTKSSDWSYEQERRYFVELPDSGKDYFFPIHATSVRQIIVGPRADINYLKSVYQKAIEQFPEAELLIALPCLREYKMNVEKMPSVGYLGIRQEHDRSDEPTFLQKVRNHTP